MRRFWGGAKEHINICDCSTIPMRPKRSGFIVHIIYSYIRLFIFNYSECLTNVRHSYILWNYFKTSGGAAIHFTPIEKSEAKKYHKYKGQTLWFYWSPLTYAHNRRLASILSAGRSFQFKTFQYSTLTQEPIIPLCTVDYINYYMPFRIIKECYPVSSWISKSPNNCR